MARPPLKDQCGCRVPEEMYAQVVAEAAVTRARVPAAYCQRTAGHDSHHTSGPLRWKEGKALVEPSMWLCGKCYVRVRAEPGAIEPEFKAHLLVCSGVRRTRS